MEVIKVFDTTLRDGEQSPGASMTVEQKVEIALQLSRLGVDVIESGFPVSSPHQMSACKKISQVVKGTTIAALARAVEGDIDAAASGLEGAERRRIHTFIATSPIHMKYKLKAQEEEVLARAVKGVSYARNLVDEVEFSPEDATRSELPFLLKVIEAAIDAGATIINIPDTVGYTIPGEFSEFIKRIRTGVPNIDKAVLSVHCHNDLGLGVANTLAAVEAGARQVEVTVNGIGERAGNASMEEFVMALSVRKDLLNYTTNIDKVQIFNTSRLLANTIAMPIPRNKPIVGENAFAHEAGIHQDGMLKHRETYEIMTPQAVGRGYSQIILGRHSGLHGFSKRLEALGIVLNKEELKTAYDNFLKVADLKKEVYDEDIITLANEVLGRTSQTYSLDYFNVLTGNHAIPTATVRIKMGDQMLEEAATGDGPVSALMNAIEKAVGISTKLDEYYVHSVTSGKQALGEVSIHVTIYEKPYKGNGSSTDIIEASAKAFINALNRYTLLNQEGSR